MPHLCNPDSLGNRLLLVGHEVRFCRARSEEILLLFCSSNQVEGMKQGLSANGLFLELLHFKPAAQAVKPGLNLAKLPSRSMLSDRFFSRERRSANAAILGGGRVSASRQFSGNGCLLDGQPLHYFHRISLALRSQPRLSSLIKLPFEIFELSLKFAQPFL